MDQGPLCEPVKSGFFSVLEFLHREGKFRGYASVALSRLKLAFSFLQWLQTGSIFVLMLPFYHHGKYRKDPNYKQAQETNF
jgi:hypothetical protein